MDRTGAGKLQDENPHIIFEIIPKSGHQMIFTHSKYICNKILRKIGRDTNET